MVFDEQSREALVIDPGGESDRILDEASRRGLSIKEIWLTHSHLDHCGGVRALKAAAKAPLTAHPAEAMMRAHVTDIAAMYGAPDGFENCPEPERAINGGETLSFAGSAFKVLFTPGHSPGHVCFYDGASGVLFAGDTVFSGSIGRTDIPGGNSDLLLESIRREILTLPDETRVLSGHGGDTTVGTERRSNPFLTGGRW
jgi:glyoxylase-like metal-dependent hydrolase (beta-lactamase superfamily II)